MPETTCDKCGEPDGGMFLFHGIVCGKTEAERAAISASLEATLERRAEREKTDWERRRAEDAEWEAEAARQAERRRRRHEASQ